MVRRVLERVARTPTAPAERDVDALTSFAPDVARRLVTRPPIVRWRSAEINLRLLQNKNISDPLNRPLRQSFLIKTH